MIRHLAAAASVLSLLLCIASVVAWVRSDTVGDGLRYYRAPGNFEIDSNDGVFCVAWGRMVSRDFPPPAGWEGSFWPFRRRTGSIEADLRRGTLAGFGLEHWGRETAGICADLRRVTLPWWLPAACFAVPPLVALRRWLRERRIRSRQREGLCPYCGYDLRGSSDRCPECGRAPRPSDT